MDGSGGYRTATVSIADVDSTMSLSGTVASSSRRDLSFGAAGDVSSVKVAAGDAVKAGAVLARLDPEDLDAAVTRAEATLARAVAQLESDQDAQASSVADAADGSSSGSKPSGSSSPTTSPAVDKALARLREQQTAVRAAQTAASEAITAAKAAVAARAEACAAGTTADDDTAEDDTTDACATALAAAEDAQDVVASRQDSLQKALADLEGTLTAAVKALGTSSSAARDGGGDKPSSDDDSSSTPTANRPGGDDGSASAGSLAQDQAAIDTAKAELTEARTARKAATLTAPFDGTVLEVSVAKGDAVSAGDVAVILAGDGGSTVTTSVTVDQVGKVAVGQTARVTPAGGDQPLTGTVTQIGMLPTTGDDPTTYPVTIDLADDVTAPEGAGATITLITATAKDVVAVPSSAVTTNRGRSTVTVLKDGKPSAVRVTVGAVGSTLTQITKGLSKGQEVVLADLGAALPSADTGNRRGFGPDGGLGGGPSFKMVTRGGPAG
jgi:multidrug efflux pump subunit AcrA (membrane-fusion protein)